MGRGGEYPEDIRALKRTKMEVFGKNLIWRRGAFSQSELVAIKNGLESWVSEACGENNWTREEALESLKWARDHKVTAWCDIATRCSLPQRKIGSIAHCIQRRMLPGSEVDRWSDEQTAEFKRLQEIHGERAWKKIAQETGRTLEDVVNKGRQMRDSEIRKRPLSGKLRREDSLRIKLATMIKNGMNAVPFEAYASEFDCRLVALVRKYMCPDGEFVNIHKIPTSRIAGKLNAAQTHVRERWHHDILPAIVQRVVHKLGDEDIIDAFLTLRLRKACRGTLVNVEGELIFPCCDWTGIDWPSLMPMWPQTVTQNRLRHVMRVQPKFDLAPLPDVTESAVKTVLGSWSKREILEAARTHMEELRKTLNIIADRGDAYMRGSSLDSVTSTVQ
jgi:hypothetical protein